MKSQCVREMCSGMNLLHMMNQCIHNQLRLTGDGTDGEKTEQIASLFPGNGSLVIVQVTDAFIIFTDVTRRRKKWNLEKPRN